MSVIENVEYGLKIRKVPKADRRRRAGTTLDMVRLSGLEERKPIQLSGGQRQRVALARAIVNEPEVLLLDEPLGALDLKLRQEMQTELKRIQREVGITFVYVTHDQEEALTMSDRLAVMSGGQIEQIGTPVEVYERPATEFVAGFIGVSNLIERDGQRVTIRPEKVYLLLDDAEAAPPGTHVEHGVVVDVVYLGVSHEVPCRARRGRPARSGAPKPRDARPPKPSRPAAGGPEWRGAPTKLSASGRSCKGLPFRRERGGT